MSATDGKGRSQSGPSEPAPTADLPGPRLEAGSRIGQFCIEREIGRGGAGVVYLAHDTKLGRPVAIKSLPAELMRDAQMRSRLKREARLLASLDHPNIATIHDIVEQTESGGYLILEYIEGDTLAEHLSHRPLDLREALSIAQQIAEAVAAAHEHGVTHRDLKPGNIKITPDGKVKVLDFGLAKATAGEAADQETTITEPGRVMGTPAYMSLEQARGQPTDKRCDIWSFGCVLYEMLTGKVPFTGETASDTLACILEREPDWHVLPQTTPANIQVLLRRCLEKDPRRRLRDIGDAGIEINEALTRPFIVSPEDRPSRHTLWKEAAFCVFVGLVLGAIVVLIVMRRPMLPTESRRVFRTVLPLDPEDAIRSDPQGILGLPTFTPDGLQVVYVTDAAGDTWLVRRPLDSLNTERIPGTQGVNRPTTAPAMPQVSPDGQCLAFHREMAIWKVPLAGGEAKRVSNSLLGGCLWEDENTLILATKNPGAEGLSRLDLRTGKSEPLTMLTDTPGCSMHWPVQVVPEGRTLLFLTIGADSVLCALPHGSRQAKRLVENTPWGFYAPSGHLVYIQLNRLLAVPFDIRTLERTGRAVDVTEVRMSSNDAVGPFARSQQGTLVYVPLEAVQGLNSGLFWVDFEGKEQPLEVPPMRYVWVRVSGDTAHPRIIADVDLDPSIWIYDPDSTSPIDRLTFSSEGDCDRPIWMPDNREIVFSSWVSDINLLKRKAADGSGESTELSVKPNRWSWLIPTVFTPDGKTLLVGAMGSSEASGSWDVVAIHLDRDGEIERLSEFSHDELPGAFSPDGKWLAYVGKERDRYEVFVTTWPDLRGKWQVSTEGGQEPVWAPDGSAIYYRDGTSLIEVSARTEGGFSRGQPKVLFDDLYVPGSPLRNYDIHPDGKRFLMIKKLAEKEQAPITELIVVENWFEELKRRVPTGQN